MKALRMAGICLAGVAVLTTGCGKKADSVGKGSNGTLCWVQPLKGHPVHQMTQIAFKEGCRRLGYDCIVVGTDGSDCAGTIFLAEQVLAKGTIKGMAIWAGNPAWNPLIERAGKAGVPVVLPHFPIPEGSAPGATGIIGCEPAAYARTAAEEIGRASGGKGAVAITQGSFNSTENMVAETFTKAMKELYPNVRVLASEEEGFDPSKSIPKAVSILQSHPDVVAALSTTGGGPTTWAGAQKETGRKIVAIGMDYTRVNLDLVKRGEVHAVIGQPLWDESFGAAELLDKAARGEKIPWWTKLPAPLITTDNLAPYSELLDKVEAAIKR
ncbi:MAG: substrate-binding domain-containing protein [Kiritimatiellae bacterium]|nr:substrate-binding domain-containing protein [Kiritimatiellia bacterium]